MLATLYSRLSLRETDITQVFSWFLCSGFPFRETDITQVFSWSFCSGFTFRKTDITQVMMNAGYSLLKTLNQGNGYYSGI